MLVLEKFPAYVEFRKRTRDKGDAGPATLTDTAASPQDLLDQAVRENHDVVANELLSRALALPPLGFEDLVMALLEAMGYGQSGRVERTRASGDAGIDGIISQDPLGLDRIYVQAKRYETDRVIQRPTIQSFVGALHQAHGDRGVFITTSSFSSGAREAAERDSFNIELIDGARLAKLMLRHQVGVQAEPPVTLFKVDEDFFESL